MSDGNQVARIALVAAGAYFGGPIGAQVGAIAGQLLFPGELPDIEGPRLLDRRITTSTLGSPINRLHGTFRTSGNVIWSRGIDETAHERKVGKGGPTQVETSYTYSSSFAVSLCEGEVTGVRRIWADGVLIYSVEDSSSVEKLLASDNVGVTIYNGSETQTPNSAIQSDVGVDNASANRGICYLVFNNLQLEKYGNRIPSITAEVVINGSSLDARRIDWTTIPQYFRKNNIYGEGTPHLSVSGNIINIGIVNDDEKYFLYSIEGNYLAPQSAGPIFPDKTSGRYPVGYYKGKSVHATLNASLTSSSNLYLPVNHHYDSNVGAYVWDYDLISGIVPDGLYITGCILSPDGNTVVIFTSSVGPYSGVDTWHKLKDGVVYSGSITGWILGAYGKIISSGFNSGIVEDNGDYIWQAYGAGNGNVTSFEIISNGAATRVFNGINNNGNGLPYWTFTHTSIYAKDGTAWAVSYNTISIFTRESSLAGTSDSTFLSSVITKICQTSGVSPSDIDVSTITDEVQGYLIDAPMSGRKALEPLLNTYNLTAYESDWKIKFKKIESETPEAIDSILLGANEDKSEQELIPTKIGDTSNLPRRFIVQYSDFDRDYIINSQKAQRIIK